MRKRRGFAVPALKSGHLELTFKRYERKRDREEKKTEEGETHKCALWHRRGVWQYEEADYPTSPEIPPSPTRYTRFRVTRRSVACRLNLEARFFFFSPLRRKVTEFEHN